MIRGSRLVSMSESDLYKMKKRGYVNPDKIDLFEDLAGKVVNAFTDYMDDMPDRKWDIFTYRMVMIFQETRGRKAEPGARAKEHDRILNLLIPDVYLHKSIIEKS